VVVCGTVLKPQHAEANHFKVIKLTNLAFVPLTYEGQTAGRVILEVFSGGYGSGMMGAGMMGAGMMGNGMMSGMAGGMMPGMATTTGGGGYAAKTTTTTTEVTPGATGVTTMYGGQGMSAAYGGAAYGSTTYGGGAYGSTMMTGAPMPPRGGYASSFTPPAGGFVSNIGPRPISPMVGPGMGMGMGPGMSVGMGSGMGVGMGSGMGVGIGPGMGVGMGPGMGVGMGPGMGMGLTRPVSPSFFAGGQQVGMVSAPPIINSRQSIMGSGVAPPIPPPALASGLRGSFMGPAQTTTTIMNSGIMPPMPPPSALASGLRRSFVAPPLPPVMSSGIMGQAGIVTSGLRENYAVNPGMMSSMIGPGAGTTTVTEITETTYNPGMTSVTTSGFGMQPPGGAMNAIAGMAAMGAIGAGQMGMSNIGGQMGMSNIGSSGDMNAMAGIAAMGAMGAGQMGMSGIGGMAGVGMSTVGVGAMGSSGVPGVAPVTGGLGMSGPTGLGVDMGGRLVDMGRIRLEKIEHYPSFNLFSMLDDHPPMATFRIMPHKLRNYWFIVGLFYVLNNISW
jgi:hypothetical protein